ncbi:patatin-like phospholipase family protein [Paraglaciecola sp.]|uniref:patatin-like phospholipase family protein n=1 Tax=Paraglaciecola sp. TaxID=1920173 RepID=UPI0030F49B43
MTYKVAIAISGAVSLGAYEAGTMYEVINAFKLHNEKNPPEEHIKIDVLTGASAGGMTAALVAQKLLYAEQGLAGPDSNVGYDAWVKSVDIDGLLKHHEGDNPNTSLLSTGFVNSIANNLILSRYADGNVTPSPQPHIASATTIKLGLAMSNLNGVNYARNIFEATHQGFASGKFVETRFQDRFTTELGNHTDNQQDWQNITNAARCCGAFPLAFSPISLMRKWTEADYQGRGADDFSGSHASGKFSFTDGGVFNNYPLGMARELAKTIDKDPLDYSKRFYFYISPNKKKSSMDTVFDADDKDIQIQHVVAKITKSMIGQAQFQDWLQTDKVNKEVALLDARAEELVPYIKKSSDETLSSMLAVTKALCSTLYQTAQPSKIEAGEPDVIEQQKAAQQENIEEAIERLTEQYKSIFPHFNRTKKLKKDAWLYTIALLEKAAKLNDRDIMRVYTITAEDTDLASEKIFSFLGFLDIRFRQHDYLRGRLNGMKVINEILNARNNKGLKDNHLPLNIEQLDTAVVQAELTRLNLGQTTISDVKRSVRESLYERAEERVYLYLKNMGMNWLLRHGLYKFFIKNKIKGYLDL